MVVILFYCAKMVFMFKNYGDVKKTAESRSQLNRDTNMGPIILSV